MWVKKPIQQVGFYERASRAGEFRALRSAILFVFWLIPAFGLESKGGFGLCGVRPGSTWTGQPARLDRAGPQARTRLSPAGGIGAVFIVTDSEYFRSMS